MAPRSVLETIQSVLQKNMVREFLAEFLSTYVMMVFGLGSVAHMVLGENSGSYLGVNLGFGFGVTMGVHVAGGISGAHMNAAVTFTNCALGRMTWKKFPVYVLGQFLGSFSAAATTYLIFYGAINHFAGGDLLVTGSKATANIFATYLPEYMTLWRGFLDEAFVTGMLQLCLFAITDKKNSPALQGTEPLVIGILVTVLGVSLGMNSGYAINPSRDLPPRLFTFIAGWGKQVFRPPSFCLQSRKQLVVGAGGGTTSGRLPRWYCIPGFNSPQHTTGSSETGEFYSKRPEGNCIIQECSFCKHKWLCASRALLSRASL
ncbi:aquaporin-7 isoform X1 [Mus musculus]|uniref:aquaporin-7 isoform 1 n=1 Tax=Mus musculus TaxID=10090 RepID=UPI0003D785AD|nr:aquaporin-7 isoform 1 [Mus musculus]XP_006537622.2 aquaporin-7 isoform X1 [Mus musculus]XP_006537626.1 aquaporin-7 isoform X1 [Mus musculus]XP_030108959.1 aquaporin-7 isoform X1 [Mus musculus]|eukprot:XP_006537622.2 PREDICTED: aquaporin-7 isoform X1 [Mus musculus]